MTDAPPPPPGWYADPVMPGTQRYWDGAEWSDHVAPARTSPQAEPAKSSGLGPFTIAAGILIAAFVLWFVYGVATANDDAECAIDNADRTIAGQAPLDCD